MEVETQRHKYPLGAVLWSVVMPSIIVLVGFVQMPRGITAIAGVGSGLLKGKPPARADLWSIVAPWMDLLLGGILLSLYTEVITSAKGMKVRVFVFAWVFVPWEDVLGVVVPALPGANAPRRWHFVQVRRLTFFHRLLGMMYLTGSKPVVVINRSIDGYEELLRVIEERIEQNQSTSTLKRTTD